MYPFPDKSFDDDEAVDGNRPSSAASAFKVPAPKKPGNPSNSTRKPGSAGGPKVGGNVNLLKSLIGVPRNLAKREYRMELWEVMFNS